MRNQIFSSPLALAIAISAFSISQQAEARPMTAADLATLNRVAAPAASPDGRFIAFQMTETQPENYQRSTGILFMDRQQKPSAPVRITDEAGRSGHSPAFGPEGSLYFLSSTSGSSQIWRYAMAGGASTQVTQAKADIAGFKISPNGARLLIWGDIPMDCPDFGCDAPASNEPSGTGRHFKNDVGFVRHWDS